MGKAADNESRKLRATFFNNCSVALVIGGVALPLLSLYFRLPSLTRFLADTIAPDKAVPVPDLLFGGMEVLVIISGAAIAFVGAGRLHSRALEIIKTIED